MNQTVNLTLERASELVSALNEVNKYKALDLYIHFAQYFQIQGEENLEEFANLCGYTVSTGVEAE